MAMAVVVMIAIIPISMISPVVGVFVMSVDAVVNQNGHAYSETNPDAGGNGIMVSR